MKDFLTFRRMISPILIQIIFWIGVLMAIIYGIISILLGYLLAGFLTLLLGPIVIRVICELYVVIFTMNNTLTDIRNSLQERNK